MIEKKYGINRTSRYSKVNWIEKYLTKSLHCKMQSNNATDEKVILLINPLVIEGDKNIYSLNDSNSFKEVKPLEFTIDNETDGKQKLEKKKNKITKNDNEVSENTKSKVKLKKRIDGTYDETSKVKKQSTSKKSKKEAGKDLLKEKPTEITLSNRISVQELAEKMYVSETDIIRTLFLDGRIININSVSGLSGIKDQSVYSSSKSGLIGFMDSLAQELKHIKITNIFPGGIDTTLWSKHNYPGDDYDRLLKTSDIIDVIKLIINLKENVVIKNLTIFPDNEWH